MTRLFAILLAIAPLSVYADEDEETPLHYRIAKTDELPAVDAGWEDHGWSAANTLTIDSFHSIGSDHKPKTQARLLHDGDTIAVHFRVEDRYVVARHTEYQSRTHKDSTVEFFIEPKPGKGYFNFEMNCGGTLLLWYVEDPTREGDGFKKFEVVSEEWGKRVEVHASLPKKVDPEIAEPTTWTVSYRIPKALFEAYVGPIESLNGQQWRGNFYKCADESSHPHWGYWADIGGKLDFHQPKQFAPVHLDD
jgi:hypothetical protein